MRLETERLLLRIPEEGDVDAYFGIYSDPVVMRFLGGGTNDREEVVAVVGRMRRHWERHGLGLFSVVRKEDERLLGRVGFLLWDPVRWVNAMRADLEGDLELEVGWTLGSEHWSHGYATEAAAACRDLALGELGWNRLVSLIDMENAASIRVAEKIGETYEREIERPDLDYRQGLWSLGAGSRAAQAGQAPAR